MQSSVPRIAAVLLLVYPKDGQAHLVFTRRTETVANHRGQISLPGGAREPEDPDLSTTALRETEEELGISAADVQLLGSLSDTQVAASNYVITPYVGTLPYRPAFRANPAEVAEVIEVPIDELRNPAFFHEEVWTLGGRPRPVQFYQHGPHQIWGATGRVVQLFLTSDYVDLACRQVSRPNE